MIRKIPDLLYRVASLGNTPGTAPETFDRRTRSVDVVIATENPVLMWDWDLGEIPETLLMAGCVIPKSRQIPLLDTHSRASTANQLGSVRELRIEKNEFVGRQVYSSVEEAEKALTKVEEGHITDNSIGYKVNDYVTVRKDETQKIAGRTFQGPHRVVTSWTPKEDSICPIGADVYAKFRDEALSRKAPEEPPMRRIPMDRALRELLQVGGLPTDASEREAWEFYLEFGLRGRGART